MGVFDFVGRWFGKQNFDDPDEAVAAARRERASWMALRRDGSFEGDQEEPLPTFLASAIDRPNTGSKYDNLLRARLMLRDVFIPTQPVTERSRFAGRTEVLRTLIEVIEEQRSHVVVYGERGIGKTSLMHILADLARDSQYLVTYTSCGATSRFSEIFRAALTQIPLLYLSSIDPTASESERGGTLADRLPEGQFDSRQLADLLAQVTGTRVLILLDEYDRVESTEFRQLVAELIKNLSDRAARIQLVLAGVASNLQELIGYIPSIRRNVLGLPMPRLSADEVRTMIRIGERAAGVSFDPKVVEMTGLLSYGSPYLARLLSHHAGMKALDDGRLNIQLGDLWAALEKGLDEAETRLMRQTAAQLPRLVGEGDLPFLATVARAANTPDGWFSEDEVDRLLGAKTDGWRERLHALSARSAILEDTLEGDVRRYRFRDEALPTYLWMLLARRQMEENARG